MDALIRTADARLVSVERFDDERDAWRYAAGGCNPMQVMRSPDGAFDVCTLRGAQVLMRDGWTFSNGVEVMR